MQNEISYNPNQNENEPEASSARRAQGPPASGTQAPPRPSVKKVRSKKATPASAQPAEPELALFSLIADPQTIAGGSPSSNRATTADADQELDRLRQALHAREQELEALRRRTEPTHSEARHAAPVLSPAPSLAQTHASGRPKENDNPPSADLLDSAQAHRLAKEARQSEQASRLALHAAREALKTTEPNAEWPARFEALADSTERPANEQSWETRPLSVQKHLLETAPDVGDEPEFNGLTPTHVTELKVGPRTIAPVAKVRSIHPEIQLRAARAEARELEATLSLARDTALTQKLEIARLRSELEAAPERAEVEMAALEEAFRAVLPEEEAIDVDAIRIEAQNQLRTDFARENEATRQEIERLRERVALGERETEARETERRILRETLAARETELQTARAELAQLTQRLQEEGDLVQELHVSLDEERENNAGTQSLLAQLRNTLQRAPSEVEMPLLRQERQERHGHPDRHEAAQRAPSSRPVISGEPGPASAAEPAFLSERPERRAHSELTELTDRGGAPRETPPAESGRLFDAWQDDQVRRHFGPFGIDTTRDLVMAPLVRRNPSLEHPAKILVLGSDAAKWTERLAEDLISSESPAFQILLGQDDSSVRRVRLQDRPIDEFITATRTPASPADFESLLAETRPSVIVSRNFLSGINDVGPWLDVLRQLPRMGPGLVFLESTGVGPVSPADAMIELGNRIWSLMPARYTRQGAQTDARIESWQQAFEKMPPIPSNGLRAALREGFELEISAQFGFLTEPFLRSQVADNFDPDGQRDRRFLHQIADLDDRKIEAGIAPALHFIARVDGRIED